MANQSLEDIFNRCVDMLADGASVQDCLDRYPQYADQLRPLLDAGVAVRGLNLPDAAMLTAQQSVWAQVEAGLGGSASSSQPWWRQTWAFAAAAVLVLTAAVVIGVSLNNDEPPVAAPVAVTFTPVATEPVATNTTVPTATDEPTNTTEPTATDEPTNTTEPTATDEPTNTAVPTATDEPTATTEPPLPASITVTGAITEIDDDDAMVIEILDSFDVIITAETILPERSLRVDDLIEVTGVLDGVEITAQQIILLTVPTFTDPSPDDTPAPGEPSPDDPPSLDNDDDDDQEDDDEDNDDDDDEDNDDDD